jgi:hypothetical protein
VGRFPQYSPYNAALLHVQNPGVSFTATRRQWQDRFDRVPEPGGPPLRDPPAVRAGAFCVRPFRYRAPL